MPHTDPQQACSLVTHYLKDMPAWPQLPRKSFLENMYAQYSEGFPGVVIEGDRIYIDYSQDLQKPLEELYAAYLENNVDRYPMGPDYAAGLHSFLSQTGLAPLAVKGQITGPLTWGLTVTDENRRAIIHDDILGDAVPRFLRLKAGWQEKQLSQISKNTVIFVDEPYMAAYGSSTSAGAFSSPEKIAEMLDEVFAGISGIKGLHCCGNTDWSVLLRTSLDVLSFDAYNYAESLSLYPSEIKKFIDRGGAIAWGIVPNDEDSVGKESVASLQDRLGEAMAPFTRDGVHFKDLVVQSLLTPSCGLDPLGVEAAGRALELLTKLSARIRKRYI
jgi:methionine synthase II (cobalamin-independent)